MVDQEHRGEKTAVEELQYLKTVFSEKGAAGAREHLDAMSAKALRTLTSAAGLPRRAGGKKHVTSELRSALLAHVAVTLCADGEEQARNLHHLICRRQSKERIQ